ncbi:MAG: acyltransferase [Dysgonomonas sp.]|nr:acyltransferase [Dysgonomonas sp.]
MKEREQYLDALRSFACILIVLTHSVPPLHTSGTSSIHAFVSFICSPSSELFLAISGALLLPVRRPTKEFLRKRFMRVFPPLLFWSCIIIIYRYSSASVSIADTLRALVCMPVKPVIGVYWFFYVISGLYIFAPIISRWLLAASNKEISFFIFLWGITLVLTSTSILFDLNFIPISGNYYFILNSFGGFLGFMILGSYLRNHISGRTAKNNIVLPLVIISSLFLLAVIGYKMRIVNSDFFMNNLSLPTALMVFAIFMLFKNIKFNNKVIAKIISEIALCSYGIYLIHIFIARGFVWGLLSHICPADCNTIITTFLSLVLSLGISYIVVRLIKLLPYSKYIVG